MSHPRFTILLPTRNRSKIIGKAIQSVLNQSISDLELIISDNDDSDEATRDAVQAFADPRIKYVRSPRRLSMHENWEFALAHATGSYVIVLEDKQRLLAQALEALEALLQSTDTKVISYGWGSGEPNYPKVNKLDFTKLTRHIATDTIIRLFADFNVRYWTYLPKGYNSCVSRELLTQIAKADPERCVFSALSPDVSFGFRILSHIRSLWHIDSPLVYSPKWTNEEVLLYSNGIAAARKGPLAVRYYKEVGIPAEEVVRNVPIKSAWVGPNIGLYDYFTKYKPPVDVAPVPINWVNYFASSIEYVRFMFRLGADIETEKREIWLAFKQCPWPFRARVALRVGQIFLRRLYLRAARLFARAGEPVAPTAG